MVQNSPNHPSWDNPGEPAALPPDEVHVWRADIAPPGPKHTWPGLSDGDAMWCAHFRDPQRRHQACAGRALLWHALARYIPQKLDTISVLQSNGAKPLLWEKDSPSRIQFSIAHTNDLVLCAFAQSNPLGVDVECIRPRAHMKRIAARVFTKRESATIQDLPFECQAAAFYRCWASKEAFLKASGTANLLQLSQVETFSMLPGENPWRQTCGEGQARQIWSFFSFEPKPSYAATCAVQGIPSGWRFWHATFPNP